MKKGNEFWEALEGPSYVDESAGVVIPEAAAAPAGSGGGLVGGISGSVSSLAPPGEVSDAGSERGSSSGLL